MTGDVRAAEYLFRRHAAEVLGTLVRRFGDLDIAEDALQEALVEALVRWPREGDPANPAAWLVTVARSKAIDRLRRARRGPDLEVAAQRRELQPPDDIDELTAVLSDGRVVDDQLSLIMLCCHPALNHEAQVALTLRVVAGLSTDEIARGFMVEQATMAQRLVRAKHKIRRAGIPFGVPETDQLGARLEAAMQVIYLVFNEGYASTHDDAFIRHDLCGEAIRLTRLLVSLVPEQPEVLGLLALMLLHDARAPGRLDAAGDLVILQRQDRTRWRHDQIDEGVGLVDRAMAAQRPGRYQIEAAIAALHSSAPTAEATDWRQIDLLYRSLLRHVPTPVVALNGAVARSMADGPSAGLAMIDDLVVGAGMERWYLLHATRAELLQRAGREDDARNELQRAIELAPSAVERQLLERRLAEPPLRGLPGTFESWT